MQKNILEKIYIKSIYFCRSLRYNYSNLEKWPDAVFRASILRARVWREPGYFWRAFEVMRVIYDFYIAGIFWAGKHRGENVRNLINFQKFAVLPKAC